MAGHGAAQPMRAGALAVIDLKNENWKDAREGGGTLVEVFQP